MAQPVVLQVVAGKDMTLVGELAILLVPTNRRIYAQLLRMILGLAFWRALSISFFKMAFFSAFCCPCCSAAEEAPQPFGVVNSAFSAAIFNCQQSILSLRTCPLHFSFPGS